MHEKFKILIISSLLLLFHLEVLAQCTNTIMLTSNGASIQSSGTYGLCLFCSVSNTANVVDANTTNFASINIPIGVGGGGYVKLAFPATYPAGTRVGFIADVNGGVLGLFNGVTLKAYLNGTQVGTVSGGTLFNVLGIGGGTNISGVFCSPFNEVRIEMGSFLGVLAAYRVYSAYVTTGCSFPVQCGTPSSTEICGDNIDNDGDGLVDNEDSCVMPCNAGSAAPLLNTLVKGNTCPASTADLTTITASNMPGGTSISWHTATPATTANKLTTLQAQTAAAGTYYATFFDATNNCYSNSGNATTAVTVSISSCCNAGSVAPLLSAATKSNTCPTATVDLTTITASNTPFSTSLTWHSATPATTANKLTNLQAQTVTTGTYYASFFDASNGCYSNAGNGTTVVIVTVNSCFSVGNAPSKTTYEGQITTGNAATELLPTAGTTPFTYTNDTGNGTCTPISGATALTGLTVTSTTGAYSYTAPALSGIYYYCIKVCDNATPTPGCQTRTYALTVLASCTLNSQTLNRQ